MARRVASGLAGLASAARLHLARGSAALRGAGARVPEPDRRVPEASRRSAPSSGEEDDGPLRWYRRRVREGSLRADARQVEALESLQDLRTRLADPRGARLGREHALWRASPVTGEGTEAVGGLVFSQDKSQGVYLHGGVGRGKTMLMDAFFATLPEHVKRKARRVHFHAFMAEVHARLHALTKSTHHTRVRFAPDGSSFSLDASSRDETDNDRNENIVNENDPRRDPLALVANEIVVRSPLVCFDEVELSDVADALVFKRVFEKVFEYGGVLVATSNAAPAKLYDGGINRAAFAPFTKELEKRTKVVSLDDELFSRREGVASFNDVSTDSTVVHAGQRGGHGGSVDHRRVNREREAAAKKHSLRDAAEHPRPSVAAGNRSALLVKTRSCGNDTVHDRDLTNALLATWRAATSGVEQHDAEIAISAGRFLRVPTSRGRGCRFSFVDLFGSHARLGAADYSTLLARYDVVFLDTVIPTFRPEDEDALRRFVNFIDIAYETKTLLIAATEVEAEALVEADDARDWFLVSESDASSYASSTSTSTSTDGSSVFSTRARVRLEGSRGAFALDNKRGGSSGRVAPMVGDAEWSATGRNGAALADLQLHNFTFRAAARCVSRLVEMGGEAYEAAWWEEERSRRRREREEAGTEVRAAMKRT
jgi:predicted ATPase